MFVKLQWAFGLGITADTFLSIKITWKILVRNSCQDFHPWGKEKKKKKGEEKKPRTTHTHTPKYAFKYQPVIYCDPWDSQGGVVYV